MAMYPSSSSAATVFRSVPVPSASVSGVILTSVSCQKAFFGAVTVMPGQGEAFTALLLPRTTVSPGSGFTEGSVPGNDGSMTTAPVPPPGSPPIPRIHFVTKPGLTKPV